MVPKHWTEETRIVARRSFISEQKLGKARAGGWISIVYKGNLEQWGNQWEDGGRVEG